MGEDLTSIRTQFNGSVRIESRPERLSGEAGALIMREVMERNGLVRWLAKRLDDPRNPDLVTHPLSELLMTTLLLLAQGQEAAFHRQVQARYCPTGRGVPGIR